MNKYFYRLSPDQKDEIRHFFKNEKKDPIFDITYRALFDQSADDLAPEEVWYEAKLMIDQIKDFDYEDIEAECLATLIRMRDYYSTFICTDGNIVQRTDQQALHSTMMVMFVVYLMLLNECQKVEEHPHKEVCHSLYARISSISGFNQLLESTRRKEDANEARGRQVPVINYLQSDDLVEFRQKTASKCKKDKTNINTDNSEVLTTTEGIIDEISNIFYNNRAEAETFLGSIKGMKPTAIIGVVNSLLEQRKISDKSCHKPLWEILNRHALYTRGLSNWNDQIRIPKTKNGSKNG